MAIRFVCERCGKKLRADDELAGQRAACSRCGARLRVPKLSTRGVSAEGRPAKDGGGAFEERPLVRVSKIDQEDMIDMTSMVDVVFFLLIFFLVTHMQALDSSIPMPAADAQKPSRRARQSLAAFEADQAYIVVRIDRKDGVWLEGAQVRSAQDLVMKLRKLRNSGAHPDTLLVAANGEASHATTVMVLDSGNEVGLEHVRLALHDEG